MEEMIKATYSCIALATDDEGIINCLPNPKWPHYKEIIEGVVSKLKTDLFNLKQEIDQNPEDIEYVNYYYLVQHQINICNSLLQKSEEIEDVPVNIVYATSDAKNNLVQEDIKSIDPEFYERIKDALIAIREGKETNNPSKVKSFKRDNSLIWERKEFKIRVIYKYIDYDSVLVFMVKTKKSDNAKKDIEPILNRNKLTKQLYTALIKQFQDKDQKEQIIKENRQVTDEIIKYLEDNYRGQKPNQDFDESTASWNMYYKLIQKYYKNHGNLQMSTPVQVKYKHCIYDLQKWLKEQNDAYCHGKLTTDQTTKLEALGMKWVIITSNEKIPNTGLVDAKHVSIQPSDSLAEAMNKNETRWHIQYELCKKYYEQNGNLTIPTKYQAEFEGQIYNIGQWISTQRALYKKGKLSAERKAQLEEIHMSWSIYQKRTYKDVSLVKPDAKTGTPEEVGQLIEQLDPYQLYELKQELERQIEDSKLEHGILTLYENALSLTDRQIKTVLKDIPKNQKTSTR